MVSRVHHDLNTTYLSSSVQGCLTERSLSQDPDRDVMQFLLLTTQYCSRRFPTNHRLIADIRS